MTEKKVYLLLTDTGTIFTNLIKRFTKARHNHASIALDSQLLDVYSFGRKKIWNPFQGGFVKEDIKNRLFQRAHCKIYSLPVTKEQWERIISFIHEIEKEENHYCYNFLGLFGFIIKRPIKREKAYFCSQFVATVLKESNVIPFEKPVSLMAPCDLPRTSSWKLEFEGKLNEYYRNATQTYFVPVF